MDKNLVSKKKIIFVITKGNWGGAQKYVFDIATNLPKDNFDVIVTAGEGNALFDNLLNHQIRTIKIHPLSRDIKMFSDIKAFFELLSIFKKEKPDIIHLNSSKIGLFGALAGKFAGVKKIIFTAHGWSFNEKRSGFSRALLKLLQWFTTILCNITIAVSEKTKKDISYTPFVTKKIIVIYNGISKNTEQKDRKTARQEILKLSSIKETFWIGTISELHKNKGLDIAIKGFSKISPTFPEAVFIIIGQGEEKENLQKLAKLLNIEEKIKFLGYIKDANQYLKAFDVFSLTSRTEALPYVILEAGIAKLPTVVSNVGGIPEIIDDKKSGILVKPENPDRVADAFTVLLRESVTRDKYSNNLYQTIIEKFSLEKMLTQTIEIYLK